MYTEIREISVLISARLKYYFFLLRRSRISVYLSLQPRRFSAPFHINFFFQSSLAGSICLAICSSYFQRRRSRPFYFGFLSIVPFNVSFESFTARRPGPLENSRPFRRERAARTSYSKLAASTSLEIDRSASGHSPTGRFLAVPVGIELSLHLDSVRLRFVVASIQAQKMNRFRYSNIKIFNKKLVIQAW